MRRRGRASALGCFEVSACCDDLVRLGLWQDTGSAWVAAARRYGAACPRRRGDACGAGLPQVSPRGAGRGGEEGVWRAEEEGQCGVRGGRKDGARRIGEEGIGCRVRGRRGAARGPRRRAQEEGKRRGGGGPRRPWRRAGAAGKKGCGALGKEEGGSGKIAAMRPKPSSSDADAGEDRLSALPDDILVLILLHLDTSVAGQTSILSRRWRRVWALLPELSFPHAREPNRIRDALEAHRSSIRHLSVEIQSASPDSVATWLLVAARRLAGHLTFRNLVPQGNEEVEVKEDEEGREQRGSFELPCFESATAVLLDLGFLGLSVPAAGVCSRLTKLCLSRIRFEGPWELGDAISSPRCPSLTKLGVRDTEGLTILTINSKSLRCVNLRGLLGLRRLAIEAPALTCLSVSQCFYFGHDQPVVSISAPRLERLQWLDSYDPSSMHLDTMERIGRLDPFFFYVYGGQESITNNHSCLRLLQHFKVIKTLILSLLYLEGLDDCSYLMDDMTVLPEIADLHLFIMAKGHAFGASTFHVLRMCSGIRMLHLKLNMEKAQPACSFGCICGQHAHWKTEQLVLYCLQEVEIAGLMGSECEISVVKQLLNWATVLKKLTVIFDCSITVKEAKEFCHMLCGFSRPEICTEFYICKGMSKVLYVPEE